MPRRPRQATGDVIYHVLNRANGRMTIFNTEGDYFAFEQVMTEARQRFDMRILSYCIMPTHWHLVLWPRYDPDLSVFVGWMTMTHAQRWHSLHRTVGTGHLYQGRFRNFPVESDEHYLTVCRYVERNALRAGLVERAQDWRWGSLWRRESGKEDIHPLLSVGPMPWPVTWVEFVNRSFDDTQDQAVIQALHRGRPFGKKEWVTTMAERLGLGHTLRPRGRPIGSK